MSSDPFGFSSARKPTTAEKLKAIRPNADPSRETSMERIDAAGAAHGFVSRDGPGVTRARRRRDIGPTLAINMRAPERVALPFIRWCEENRYSYWEGLEEMMRQLSILDSQR